MSWGDLYAEIATATGYRFCDIDELTLPEVLELQNYWSRFPPTHRLLAAFVGYGEKRGQPTPEEEAEYINRVPADEFDELIRRYKLTPIGADNGNEQR